MDTEQTVKIIDPLGPEDESQPVEYGITSYGADYPVETLVSRMRSGDIYTPAFQRGFVWDHRMASRFIESLLLGLPVPGIFLYREEGSGKLVVVDGQQRLKTLQFFEDGIFDPLGKTFSLQGVDTRFKDATYKTLEVVSRRKLDDSIIHATIIRQDKPEDDLGSIYHIFERLNTGGKQLSPQEMRSALYHGPLVDLITELNEDSNWRSIFGPVDRHRRDQELITRFLAFYFFQATYEAPMKQFLNRFLGRNRHLQLKSAEETREIFCSTIALAFEAIGQKAFRPQRALNAAVFESVMVGMARRIAQKPIADLSDVMRAYEFLLQDPIFLEGITRATANEKRVQQRFATSEQVFSSIQ